MSLRDNGELSKVPPRNYPLGQSAGPISSLNEAWLHTLDACVVDGPLNEALLPLMRNCFFGGAMHAVFLLQNGHGEQLASDMAGLIEELRQL